MTIPSLFESGIATLLYLFLFFIVGMGLWQFVQPYFKSQSSPLEDLILSKLIWIQEIQSDRQMGDIKSLLDAPHDKEYLNKWKIELGLKTFGLI